MRLNLSYLPDNFPDIDHFRQCRIQRHELCVIVLRARVHARVVRLHAAQTGLHIRLRVRQLLMEVTVVEVDLNFLPLNLTYRLEERYSDCSFGTINLKHASKC